MASRSGRRGALFTLIFLSGATSLVYEVLWLRQLILILGSTLFATSAILASFMGGLALGSFVTGRVMDRSRAVPLRLYGAIEIAIGLYALCAPLLFRALQPLFTWAWSAGGEHSFFLFSAVKAAAVAAILLPPTFLMGASLPVLARDVADDAARIGGLVGSLYAVNTFGAVAGTFTAGFVMIPTLGVRATTWTTATVNLILGVSALLLSRRPTREVGTHPEQLVAARERSAPRAGLVLLLFGVSGFSAMALEVAWTRGLCLVLGSSVYAFSLMLLAFLIGLAAGGAVFSAFVRRRPGRNQGLALCLLFASTGILAYATAFVFQFMPRIFAQTYLHGGIGPISWFVIQFLFGLVVMFPATFALGGIFPVALQYYAPGLERVAESVGAVYAANTAGTIIGAASTGFLIVPLVGVRNTLVIVAVLEVILGLVALAALVAPSGRTRLFMAVPMAAAIVLMPVFRPGWDTRMMNSGVYISLWELPEGATWEDFASRLFNNNRILYHAEGLTASVMVAEQPKFNNVYLAVNGKVEASTAGDMETQLVCGHLPILLHENARDVLVIGLASGITAGAVAAHPVNSVRVIEIEEAVVPAAKLFAEANGNVLEDPRLTLAINDARNELTFSPRRYDVIVSEPSNPWMTVASNLFTEDFFRLARARLKPGGVMSQWIQTYGLPPEDLRSVIAAYREAFPEVALFKTFDGIDLVMLGSDRPLRFDLGRMESRMAELRVLVDLSRIGVRRPMDFLPLFLLGEAEVTELTRLATRNTDDNARVEFSAPRALYADTTEANLEMIQAHRADPLDYVVPRLETVESRDASRLQLAKSWLSRGAKSKAAHLARSVSSARYIPEAKRFLEDNRL